MCARSGSFRRRHLRSAEWIGPWIVLKELRAGLAAEAQGFPPFQHTLNKVACPASVQRSERGIDEGGFQEIASLRGRKVRTPISG